jgi:hypothetical protein
MNRKFNACLMNMKFISLVRQDFYCGGQYKRELILPCQRASFLVMR